MCGRFNVTSSSLSDILMELVLTSYFAEAHFTLSHVKRILF